MNPKVVWRIWNEPTPANIWHKVSWSGCGFNTREDAEKHIEKTGGNKGEFWTWAAKKFPKGRK